VVRFSFAALVGVVALGVAACGGGGVTSTPQAAAASTSLSASGTPISATGVTGITGSVTIAGSGRVTVSASASEPAGLPALSLLRANSAKSEAGTSGNVPLVYISIVAVTATTITGFADASFTFSSVPSGSVYLAQESNGAWNTIDGPATISGATVTFGPVTFSPPVQLDAGAVLNLVVYGGSPVGVSPSASPSGVPLNLDGLERAAR